MRPQGCMDLLTHRPSSGLRALCWLNAASKALSLVCSDKRDIWMQAAAGGSPRGDGHLRAPRSSGDISRSAGRAGQRWARRQPGSPVGSPGCCWLEASRAGPPAACRGRGPWPRHRNRERGRGGRRFWRAVRGLTACPDIGNSGRPEGTAALNASKEAEGGWAASEHRTGCMPGPLSLLDIYLSCMYHYMYNLHAHSREPE